METRRRLFNALVGTVAFGLVPGASVMAEDRSKQESKPNILFFITDDESWLERSAYGWSKLPTPGFDHVVQQGSFSPIGLSAVSSKHPALVEMRDPAVEIEARRDAGGLGPQIR